MSENIVKVASSTKKGYNNQFINQQITQSFMKTKEELRLYFENGDIPKQEDFWEWQNSYWHKSEKLPNSSLELITYEEFLPSPTDNTEIMGIGKRIVFPEGIKVIGV
ncbi:hypothetical protein [Chryseobacterium sp. 7]|uniref:hypothetical protein n=1 Tax=Chryseobacterium sp. 7 TaxID=2035214 RepID=UPI000EB24D9F|nr:hypothetical protein [Chryseobacterium sp. 7]